jgi:hypothetical protein
MLHLIRVNLIENLTAQNVSLTKTQEVIAMVNMGAPLAVVGFIYS